MVKANELRKGNLFLYKGNITEVVGIDQNDNIIIDNNYYDEGIEHVKEDDGDPIHITPEWLERCGFEYKDGASDYGHYRHNLVYIYQHDTDPGLFHFSRGHMEGAKVEIKYVHQLQNLYFALTGDELNLKL